MIQLVLAVEQLQIGEILLENVNVRLQEGLSKSLKQIFTTQTFLLVALNKKKNSWTENSLHYVSAGRFQSNDNHRKNTHLHCSCKLGFIFHSFLSSSFLNGY